MNKCSVWGLNKSGLKPRRWNIFPVHEAPTPRLGLSLYPSPAPGHVQPAPSELKLLQHQPLHARENFLVLFFFGRDWSKKQTNKRKRWTQKLGNEWGGRKEEVEKNDRLWSSSVVHKATRNKTKKTKALWILVRSSFKLQRMYFLGVLFMI